MSRARRWWTYQRERFSLTSHGLLVAAFSLSALSFSASLRQAALPPWPVLAAGFLSSLAFFFELRVADEFKDREDDARYRPYRPVPRGLMSLPELGWAAGGAALLQLGLCLALAPVLLPLLVVVWTYMGLMTAEFFAPRWLRRHPLVYLFSHMAVIPLYDLYVTAWDWLRAGASPPAGLGLFLLASLGNGIALELGRKIRAPEGEEEGVETYSALWGPRTACLAWVAALVAAGVCAVLAAEQAGVLIPMAVLLAVVLGASVLVARGYLVAPTNRAAARIEHLSGVWTLLLYVGLGVLPRLLGTGAVRAV